MTKHETHAMTTEYALFPFIIKALPSEMRSVVVTNLEKAREGLKRGSFLCLPLL